MKINDIKALRKNSFEKREAQRKELSALVRQLKVAKERREAAKKKGNLREFRKAGEEYESIRSRIQTSRGKITAPTYNTPEIYSKMQH